jgi:Protein of unknown function (DUF4435)
MISIAKDIDAHDIAQEIRQERQVHKGSFLLLEGDRDIKRFTKFIDENACSIQNCFGRENLIGAIEILYDEGFPGVLGLADSDFDRLNNCLPTSEGIIFSESHDFDLDIARSDVLRRYLVEVAHQDKCDALGGPNGVRALLYEACKPLSVFRYLSHTQNLEYRLSQVRHHEICNGASVDADLLIEHVSSGRFGAENKKQEMKRLVRNHTAREFDFQQLTNGHDFLTMLGILLQGKLGDRKPPQAWGSEIEIHFRLAFSEEDFVVTPFFAAILQWQNENKPYLILKAALLNRQAKELLN